MFPIKHAAGAEDGCGGDLPGQAEPRRKILALRLLQAPWVDAGRDVHRVGCGSGWRNVVVGVGQLVGTDDEVGRQIMPFVGRGPIFVAETEVDGEFRGDFPVVVEVAAIVAVADIADEDAAESGGIGVAQEKSAKELPVKAPLKAKLGRAFPQM